MDLGRVKNVMNIGPEQADNCHGTHRKDMFVLHETVSPDYPGWDDIRQTSQYLDNKDYGIHGITDKEGHKAWSVDKEECIFYHTQSNGSKGNGNINSRAMGIEMVSRVMLQAPDNLHRWKIWMNRHDQIDATAQLIAHFSRIYNIPLVYSEGHTAGITTHWQITTTFGVSGGHVDCWPKHKGGYFPALRVIERARFYRRLRY